MKTSLSLRKINFPNSTLSPGWYNGDNPFIALELIGNDIEIIKTGAFDAEPFKELRELTFLNNPTVEFEHQIFRNLRKLEVLIFRFTIIKNMDTKLLQPVDRTLIHLSYFGLPVMNSFDYMLGKVRFSKLVQVRMHSTSTEALKILGPSNFTSLLVLKYLDLSHCGIEVILNQTFDFLGETVEVINLEFNELSAINAKLFHIYLDRQFLFHKKLFLTGNPFICDCDFFEYRNMTSMNLFENKKISHCYKNLSCVHSVDSTETEQNRTGHLKCHKMSTIHVAKICQYHSQFEINAHPKFHLSFQKERESISLKTHVIGSFRLLVKNLELVNSRPKKRCPSRELIHKYAKCYILSKEERAMPFTKFLAQSKISTFFVIHVSSKKTVWPLNCMTLRNWEQQFENHLVWTRVYLVVLIAVIFLIVGLIIGISLAKCLRGIKKDSSMNEIG